MRAEKSTLTTGHPSATGGQQNQPWARSCPPSIHASPTAGPSQQETSQQLIQELQGKETEGLWGYGFVVCFQFFLNYLGKAEASPDSSNPTSSAGQLCHPLRAVQADCTKPDLENPELKSHS